MSHIAVANRSVSTVRLANCVPFAVDVFVVFVVPTDARRSSYAAHV